MSTQKIENYCGIEIHYNVEESRFIATDDEEGKMESDTLKGLRARIDRIGVEKRKAQPKQKVIRVQTPTSFTWNRTLVDATAGAFGFKKRWSGGSKNLYAWITEGRRDRSCVRMDENYGDPYIIDTPENRKELEDIVNEGKILDALIKNRASILTKRVEKLTKVAPILKHEDLPEW